MLTAAEVMDGVDRAALMRLPAVHSDRYGEGKFADWQTYAEDALKRVRELGLDLCDPISILDVGCAFGYFVRACKMLGHQAEGVDMPLPIYDDACKLLDVKVNRGWINAQEAITPEAAGYHLINLQGFGLPRRGVPVSTNTLWADWAYFIDDLLDRLYPQGRLAVLLNHGRPWQMEKDRWNTAFGLRANVNRTHDNQFILEKR